MPHLSSGNDTWNLADFSLFALLELSCGAPAEKKFPELSQFFLFRLLACISYCSCVPELILVLCFWYMKQLGNPCGFYFFLSISLNRWNLTTLFQLKHSPSCTLSLFKYNWVNQVIRGSPEMCEAELDYFVWRMKIKRVIKQWQPSGTSVLASQGWQWGWFCSLCHAGSSKLLSHFQFWVLHSPHVQTFVW